MGECQICGATQRLPGGAVATHGYTTRFGFFEGTCDGSGYLPFEESCGQIQAKVSRVKHAIQENTNIAYRPETGIGQDETRAWVQIYTTGRMGRLSKVWVEREVSWISPGEGRITLERYDAVQTRTRIDFYGPEQTAGRNDMILKLNRKYAEVLRSRVRELASYVEWQEKRLAAWERKPLRPVHDMTHLVTGGGKKI
jgi:hypothetical protein